MDTTFDKIKAERQELDILLDNGIEFTINQIVKTKKKVKRSGILSFIPKYEITEENKEVKYTIHQPTLRVLDRLSYEFLDLGLDEEAIKSNFRHEAIKIASGKAEQLARIVAIAVLGLEYKNEKKLEEYTEIFYSYTVPSKLFKIAYYISTMGNYGDFINSIRLMSGRTTNPNRIEENKQD